MIISFFRIEEQLIQEHAPRCEALFERNLLERLDGREIWPDAVGQWVIADNLAHRQISSVVRRSARVETLQPFVLRPGKSRKDRLSDPRMLGKHGVLHHNGSVEWIDSRAFVPLGLQLRGVGKEVPIMRFFRFPIGAGGARTTYP